jgi:hypothetical protein
MTTKAKRRRPLLITDMRVKLGDERLVKLPETRMYPHEMRILGWKDGEDVMFKLYAVPKGKARQ